VAEVEACWDSVWDVTEPRRAYLIVGNPRTGSSVLARALMETGRLGRPEEYFWRWQEMRWASRFGLPTPDESNYVEYVQAALQYGTTSNVVFATEQFVEEWRHETDGCAACEDDSER
jgi:LPS sulfotransferase NodH